MKWLIVVLALVAATAQAEIYRWRDGRGTTHYTNREDEIPSRYRSQAVVLNLGLPVAPAPGAVPTELPASPAGAQTSSLQQVIPQTAGSSRPVQVKPLATTPARPRRERAPRED